MVAVMGTLPFPEGRSNTAIRGPDVRGCDNGRGMGSRFSVSGVNAAVYRDSEERARPAPGRFEAHGHDHFPLFAEYELSRRETV